MNSEIRVIEQALAQDGPNQALTDMPRLERLSEVISVHGAEAAFTLAILIVGLLSARLIDKGVRKWLGRLLPNAKFVKVFCNFLYLGMVAIVVSAAAVEFGAHPVNVFRFLTILTLVALGLLIFFRPFLPSMPFKVGNTIKTGDLLGIVEGITFINTRLRTFDGKTIFVPNRKIINDVIINYHFSPTRRIKIDVGICYDQDLHKAKQVFESVMVEDPRVKEKPAPAVYVLGLIIGSVQLGGRCWVDNKDFWVARCDMIEKTKHRFDDEGIRFAFPQMGLHHHCDRMGCVTATPQDPEQSDSD
jgi:small conductance mechanosensitive channel